MQQQDMQQEDSRASFPAGQHLDGLKQEFLHLSKYNVHEASHLIDVEGRSVAF
jgi:hypothetical protein